MRLAVLTLVVMVVVAATVAAGVVAWNVDRHRPLVGIPPRAADLAVRPQLQWVLDVGRLSPGGVERPVMFPTAMNRVGPAAVADTGGTVITGVGHPLYGRIDSDTGLIADSATLIGLDRTTGEPIWRRPVGSVTQWTEYPDRSVFACWGPHRVVLVDVATGAELANRQTDFLVTYVWVIDGVVYTSGQTANPQTRSVVLEVGTPGDPTATSRRTIDVSGRLPYVAEVLPRRGVFSVTESVDGPIQYRTAVFRIDTGARVFAVDGDVHALGRSLYRSESYATRKVSVLRADGSTALDVPGPSLDAVTAGATIDGADATAIVGAEVLDPDTGRRLWRDPVLVTSGDSAARAVVAGVIVIADVNAQTLIGADARTGRRTWTTPWRDAYWVRGGPTDGRHLVFADYVGMHSLDTVTGQVLWTVRFPRGVDPRSVTLSGLRGDTIRSTGLAISLWR